ncbi:MAG: hypothetical protein GWP14_10570 [Actinobacteria bacterium]|nr:hypothetical protein [Actinomycetota bacterium]
MGKSKPLIFAFAGGGTGGHLLPGLAVAESLRQKCPEAKVHFFVTYREIDEKILQPTGYSFTRQWVEPFSLNPWGFLSFAYGLVSSTHEAAGSLAVLRPAVILGLGGYAAAPVCRIAGKLKIPVALLNPDAAPGRANRWLARRAQKIFTQWDRTADLFFRRTKGQILVTGCPVRKEVFSATREYGLKKFDLQSDKKTLLVPGGSQGAMNINRTIIELLRQFDAFADTWQILHLTGPGKLDLVRQAYHQADVRIHYKLVDFTFDMPAALAAANLVLSRAGASSLAEFTARGLPAVLMPYPYGRDQHQLANAKCLADAGAAVIVPDKCDSQANADAVGSVLLDLMTNKEKLTRMSSAYEPLFKPDAAVRIAEELLSLANQA